MVRWVIDYKGLTEADLDFFLEFWRGGFGNAIGFRREVGK